MELFINLLSKLIPLYIFILLGFIAGRFLKINKENIAKLLIYIIAPIIVFHGVVTTKLNLAVLSLPVIFFCLCSFICLASYIFARNLWKDETKNILAFAAGSGNAGYFGLPVAVTILGDKVLGLVAIIILAFILYENTVGFFITARGKHTPKESLKRIITLPAIYAFSLGIILNLSGAAFGPVYYNTVNYFRNVYIVLGMMLVGLGIGDVKEYKFDFKFISTIFAGKFIVWPLLMFLVIYLDSVLFRFYNNDIHKVMMLLSVMPIAANTVAFATILKTHPEKSAVAVALTTAFAIFYIPLMTIFFIK